MSTPACLVAETLTGGWDVIYGDLATGEHHHDHVDVLPRQIWGDDLTDRIIAEAHAPTAVVVVFPEPDCRLLVLTGDHAPANPLAHTWNRLHRIEHERNQR